MAPVWSQITAAATLALLAATAPQSVAATATASVLALERGITAFCAGTTPRYGTCHPGPQAAQKWLFIGFVCFKVYFGGTGDGTQVFDMPGKRCATESHPSPKWWIPGCQPSS